MVSKPTLSHSGLILALTNTSIAIAIVIIRRKQEQERGYTAQITTATFNIIPLKDSQVTLKELSNTSPVSLISY